MKRLPKVATEMALHVLAYNLTRDIVGVQPLMAAIRAEGWASARTTRSLTAAGQAIQSIPARNCKNMASLPVPEFVSWCSLVSVPTKTFSRNHDPKRTLSRLIFGRTWLPLLCYLPAARETVVLPVSTSHSQGSR